MAAPLFTNAELDAWTGTTIAAPTFALVLELVTTAIRGEVGAATYDALADVTPLKLVALDVARRMLRNGEGLRSAAFQIDDYSETITYATETLDAPGLTPDDIDQIRRALGLSSGRAFTIRPAGMPDCGVERAWC